VTLAISTTAATASLRIRNLEGHATAVFLCGILALLLLPRSRRRNSLAVVLLMLMAGSLAACNPGSSTHSNPGTTLGTSTVTVSAKTPTYTASQALTLTVTP
jgi:glycerol uptake facilitator-like aquaporin